MSLRASRDRLLEAVLAVLWAHWTELGVAGIRGSSASFVDPEALLLATSTFGRYEPRLFDEVLDWLSASSALLDVSRLRRLARRSPSADRRVMAALVDFMRTRSSPPKWEGAAAELAVLEDAAVYGSEPLFAEPSGRSLPVFGEMDPLFAEHGLERPPVECRGMSSPPDPSRRTLLRLRLRALAGQGYRAETLFYLATHDHAHGRLVAERAAYAQRQVAEYLSSLADAGIAQSWEEGRTVQYRQLVPFGADTDGVGYVDWATAFVVIDVLWRAVREAADASDAYEASVRLRAASAGMKEISAAEGSGFPLCEPERHPGPLLVEHVIECADRVAARLFEFAN